MTDMRRALLLNSAALAAIVRAQGISERTEFVIRTGEAGGTFTIGEALDIADAALEPSPTLDQKITCDQPAQRQRSLSENPSTADTP